MRYRRFAFTLGLPYDKLQRKVGGPKTIDVDDPVVVRIWTSAYALLDAKLGKLLAIRAELDRRLRYAKRAAIEKKVKSGEL